MSLALCPSKYGTHTQRTLDDRGRGHDVRHCAGIKETCFFQGVSQHLCCTHFESERAIRPLVLSPTAAGIHFPLVLCSLEFRVTSKAKINARFGS